MNRMIIGQYYPSVSHVHSTDPRVKILAVFLYITMLFFAKTVVSYLFAALCLGLVVYASNVPVGLMLKGLRSIFVIIILTVSLHILFTPGEKPLFEYRFIKIYSEGIAMACMMAARLGLLIVGSSVLTLTTSPILLTEAIEYILKPFKRIGVPSHDIAMMTTIALRFIPTLLEETDRIIKAQTARGAGFDTGA